MKEGKKERRKKDRYEEEIKTGYKTFTSEWDEQRATLQGKQKNAPLDTTTHTYYIYPVTLLYSAQYLSNIFATPA